MNSSSGAVFSSLAENVLDQQGVVYGVAMSEDCYSAEFISVTSKKQLTKLRGSKYLQAKVGNTYKLVKKDLISGKLVLFSGTGCQVNGLKIFLGKDYDNLICVDVICHGVPSPALWREYATYQEQKNGGKLKGINFRCKDDSWTNIGITKVLNEIHHEKTRKIYIPKNDDSYMSMFLKNVCLRPACYECVAKKTHMADLTIGDCWRAGEIAAELYDGVGISLVLIRTKKGENKWNTIINTMRVKEVAYQDGIRGNSAEYSSCDRPLQRNTFFKDMKELSYSDLEKKYAPVEMKTVTTAIKLWVKNKANWILQIMGIKKKNNGYSLEFVFEQKRDTL